jgi:hypothetical protein
MGRPETEKQWAAARELALNMTFRGHSTFVIDKHRVYRDQPTDVQMAVSMLPQLVDEGLYSVERLDDDRVMYTRRPAK